MRTEEYIPKRVKELCSKHKVSKYRLAQYMRVQDEEFKTIIYNLMNGHYDLDKFVCEESSVVEDEFAEGKYCEKLYSEMLTAYGRICQRLHEPSGEDRDVEIIINNLLDMGRYQSMKMFDYGAFFAKKENTQ